jgi:hypothetical protein
VGVKKCKQKFNGEAYREAVIWKTEKKLENNMDTDLSENQIFRMVDGNNSGSCLTAGFRVSGSAFGSTTRE